MPHSTADETTMEQWASIITTAHKKRIEPVRLTSALKELQEQHPIAADAATNLVLDFRDLSDKHDNDPLVARYAKLFLDLQIINPSTLLLGIFKQTTHFATSAANASIQKLPLPTFEEKAFLMLREVFTSDQRPSPPKLHGTIYALTRWMNSVSEFEMAQQLELGPLHTVDLPTAGMYEALALLIMTVFGDPSFRDIEKQPWWNTRRRTISDELNKFDINVLQWSHSQLTGHLQNLTVNRPFLETDKKGKPIFTREHILAVITDLPAVNTRTSLCMWLSACLAARPLLDDANIQNYLLVRCHDDIQTATLSLILASFDVLTNTAMQEQHTQKTIRSFICNKLPLLLTSFSVLMTPDMVESCISMALVSVSVEPGSPLGSGNAASNVLKDTKTDFIHACMLHTILSETSANTLLHDQSPRTKITRYTKATLVSQCTSNISKLDSLVNELTSMNGNVGAISTCIAQLITNLCTGKDSMTLKTTCASLLRKMPSMDYVLQHVRPGEILLPVWQLLNDWIHEQDQTEFQPPYEEFAVILLFGIAFIDRYGISAADLGLVNDDSFMNKLTTRGTSAGSLDSLTEEQNKQLSSWIHGLYATDEQGETVGITDDVYSQCPPQAFYLLVPTLFEQTVLATKSQVLTVSIMKGGLEFLLEPFLLPSLIGGLSWIADTPWQDVEDTNIRLQVLDKLLRPSNPSQEVQTMHKAVLAIVSDTLVKSLQRLVQNHAGKKKEVDALLKILQPHTGQRRHNFVLSKKLDSWTSEPGGIKHQLNLKILELSNYATQNAAGAPQAYDPFLYWEAIQLLGPNEILNVIINNLIEQQVVSSASTLLDICTALICSPDPQSNSHRLLGTGIKKLTVRDCLRCLNEDDTALLNMPFKRSEAIVRLSRSVQLQSGASQLTSQIELASIALPSQDATDTTMSGLGLTGTDATLDAAAAAIINEATDNNFESTAMMTDDAALNLGNPSTQDLQDMNLMSMDQSQDIFGDLNLDLANQTNQLNAFGGTGGEGGDTNADDDIFGDLDMTNLGDDFTFT